MRGKEGGDKRRKRTGEMKWGNGSERIGWREIKGGKKNRK